MGAGFPPPHYPGQISGSEGTRIAETDIDIVNTALIQLGQTPITAFGQNSGTGLILQASYNRSRDDLLRRQPWNFARSWSALASLTDVPLNMDIIPTASDGPGLVTYSHAYQLPIDCIRVFRFSPKDAHWRIVGRRIYTDAVPPSTVGVLLGLEPSNSNGSDNVPTQGTIGSPVTVGLEYISRITDPDRWDTTFRQAFVFKLMKEMAFGITGLMQAYQMAKTEYDDIMKDAASLNGIENWPDPFWDSDLNSVRYGYIGVTIEGY